MEFLPSRFHFLIVTIVLVILVLVIRLIDLTVFEKNFLQSQGDARSKRIITMPAYRGIITDRIGYPLAISAPVYSVWVNPKEIDKNSSNVTLLNKLLNLKADHIKNLVDKYKDTNREFAYLKRDISPKIAKKIQAMSISGVYLANDYKRFYPEGEVTSHLIGFTNIDDVGQEGIELVQNDWLSGMAGKEMVLKDRLGRVISLVQNIKEKKPGKNLALSIDHKLQYVAFRELLAGVKNSFAESGSVVVLDVETGEVLAMTNQPSFNPNNRSKANSASFRNRAVTDVFEPGSTIKAFSVASALESGLFQPSTIIDTYPGWLKVGNNFVRDEHNKSKLSVAQILQISSNVGITKMVLELPREQLWDMFHKVGFGQSSMIGFPGERSGELVNRDPWGDFQLATLAFGYGMTLTTLQLAEAYSVIANYGIKKPTSIYKLDKKPVGDRVMKADVAKQMLDLLESVISEKKGTGKSARVDGYRVAGKTGTARIVGVHGYEKNRHISSFVGIAPVSNPKYIIAVVVRDPQGKKYFGGDVSAPIFKKIMESALHLANIKPDSKV
ncbi:penicillin-binding transpeptidase domain-containing protein [Gammaproteobacteria bacterium]|nr:penicillin-binding transpeptidase domain-containing protein [Gammaproteobacteria bacterium]